MLKKYAEKTVMMRMTKMERKVLRRTSIVFD